MLPSSWLQHPAWEITLLQMPIVFFRSRSDLCRFGWRKLIMALLSGVFLALAAKSLLDGRTLRPHL